MVEVFIPASLRSLTDGTRSVKMNVTTVREAVDQLEGLYPGIKQRLCANDRLHPALAVAIDSRICGKGLLETLPPNSELHFIPAVSGGA